MRKKVPVAVKELREKIEDMVKLFGLPETEELLGIVIMGVRKHGIENVKESEV